ncbi:MAG: hypothetical protein LBV55_00305 [Acholeplasmatales bacterium]|jgi:alpha-tubulin suppressor-like RCC1 family protein|nr:hypothetical protein [Acholeplasmatales bacterium]
MKKILILFVILFISVAYGLVEEAHSFFSSSKELSAMELAPIELNGGVYQTQIFIGELYNMNFNAYVKSGYTNITYDIDGLDLIFPYPDDYVVEYHATSPQGASVSFTLNITVWSFKKIVTGNNHTLGLSTTGKIWSWGLNDLGQLGLGDTNNRLIPTMINTNTLFKDISATSQSSFALDESGHVWCWGSNEYGLNGSAPSVQSTPVLRSNPNNYIFSRLATNGIDTMGAITAGGDLYAWGNGTRGGLGNGVDSANNPNMTKINFSGQAQIVSFGRYGGLILDRNFEVWAFGTNEKGELGLSDLTIKNRVPTKMSGWYDIISVEAGIHSRMMIDNYHTAFAWGDTTNNLIGVSPNTGTKYTPTMVTNSALSVICGVNHNAILKDDGTALLFGRNTYGQLGTYNTNTYNTNITFDTGFGIEQVYLLENSTLIYVQDEMYGFGRGSYGVLGNNNDASAQHQQLNFWAIRSNLNLPLI